METGVLGNQANGGMGLPFRDKSLSYEERVKDLLSRLTVEEKIGMLSTHHQPVERLGIGEWYVGTECARGYVTHDNDKPSTVFPQPIGMSSMFDDELMYKIGEIAGNEFRAYYNRDGKGGLMVWGPTVDMERDPRWGRTEEAYGEDPYLTGRMTIGYTKGLRGDDPKVMKTVPTLKHFCADNNEKGRGNCSANLEPRTKHEYYYAAFKPSIVKGGAYSMMAAYNELSGVPAILNPELQTVVKDEWGLGFVVSDGGDFSQNVTAHKYCDSHAESLALCIKAGCDVMTDDATLVATAAREALRRGLMTEADIDKAIGNSLDGRFRLGEFDGGTIYDGISMDIVNCEEYRKVNLQAAKEGVTLLKNTGILPLNKDELGTVLVCGPLADENHRDWYTGCTTYEYSVLDGLKMSLGEDKVLYDNGYDRIAIRSVATGKYLTIGEDGKASCTADSVGINETFEYQDLDFDVLNIYSVGAKRYLTFTDTVQAETEKVFQWFTTEIVHERAYEGYVTFNSRTHQEVQVDADGKLVCRPKSRMTDEKLFEIELLSSGAERVAELAAKADKVIVCVGNHPLQVARECWDRPDIVLPKLHQNLTKAAYDANSETICLIVSSYPFAVNWEDENLPAVVYTSHAGPELGTAVAACLLGEYNPAGRTPMTWYRSVRELPDLLDYDIIRNHVTYQYYDGEALYPFGHGLSYASFVYDDFAIADGENDSDLVATVTVTNRSDVAGDEVVQLYYHPESTRIPRPIKKLCGFRRISLAAGESKTITMVIDREELAFWDVSQERFAVEDGEYTFMVGASSDDIRDSITMHVDGEVIPQRDLSVETKAINYDDKNQAKMLWSKKLEAHYMTPSGFSGDLIFKNCCMDGNVLELNASSWERAQNITVLAECDGKSQKLGELMVAPTDSRDDFKKLLLPIAPEFACADLHIILQGSVALLSIRIGKEN